MVYSSTVKAIFKKRINRFVAQCDVDNQIMECHVKNTGRLRELLLPNTAVVLQHARSPQRKTRFDLISVQTDVGFVNIDSQVVNKVFGEWLHRHEGITDVRAEHTFGRSRLDFFFTNRNQPTLCEVKGVTLLEDGVARFPDAPTLRGIKHLEELQKAILNGYDSWAVFVIARKGARSFEPNKRTHPEFAATLHAAQKAGVKVLAMDCVVTENEIHIDQKIDVHI